MKVSDKRPIGAEDPTPVITTEREETTVAESASAATHRQRLEFRGLELGQPNPGLPE